MPCWPCARSQEVRVWSRDPAKRAAFAAETTERFGTPVHAVETAEQAVRGADIVVTATYAKEPVLSAEWVEPGAHINAMGSNQAPAARFPPNWCGAPIAIAVDSIEQARMESGDLLMALDEDDWSSPRIVELKDVVSGRRAGAHLAAEPRSPYLNRMDWRWRT